MRDRGFVLLHALYLKMANLLQKDRNIIAEHPLDKHLDNLRDPLRKAEANCESHSLSHHGVVQMEEHMWRTKEERALKDSIASNPCVNKLAEL